MARYLELNDRHYQILSEPHGEWWKARVVEVAEDGSSDEVGIEAVGDTRSAADAGAERKLKRLLQAVRKPSRVVRRPAS